MYKVDERRVEARVREKLQYRKIGRQIAYIEDGKLFVVGEKQFAEVLDKHRSIERDAIRDEYFARKTMTIELGGVTYINPLKNRDRIVELIRRVRDEEKRSKYIDEYLRLLEIF